MKRVPIVSWSVLAFAASASLALGQAEPAKPAEKTKPAAEQKAPAGKAIVVFLGNEKCPGDDKPVNRDKSVEVDGQRVYVCSDECVALLKKDASAAKAALTKAYPKAAPVSAKECTCGAPVAAGKTTDITWQGHTVALCAPECATEFKKSPATAIVLLMHPELKDAKNTSDPFDGKPVDPTIVGVYKTHLIHFSNWSNAAAFEKDPEAAVTKLKLSS